MWGQKFPSCILDYVNLKELTLDCWITQLPDDLSALSGVEKAVINLPLYEIPDSVGDLSFVKKLKMGFSYHYSDKYTSIPDPFPQWYEEYQQNKPTTLPSGFIHLENLKKLKLLYLRIESLPPEVKEYFQSRKDTLKVNCSGVNEDLIVTEKNLGSKVGHCLGVIIFGVIPHTYFSLK